MNETAYGLYIGFLLFILLMWLVWCYIAGTIARNKGNSFAAAFFISILLSPLIGIIIASVQTRNEATVEEQRLRTGALIKCPFCAELIKNEARVCRYCGRKIPELTHAYEELSHYEVERISTGTVILAILVSVVGVLWLFLR